jgi:HlyD family secretion protein
MARQIYREAALARLSSPEQLDQLMTVATPKAWISLATLGGIVVMAVLWSVLGSIPTTVGGTGILLKQGGIYDVEVLGSGVVTQFDVRVGDLVEEGQVIATISQPGLVQDIKQAKQQLTMVQGERTKTEDFHRKNQELELGSLRDETELIRRNIIVVGQRVLWLEEKIEAEREALGLGIITKDQLQNSMQALGSARGDIANLEIRAQGIESREMSLKVRQEREIYDIDQRLVGLENQIANLELRLGQSGQVISPYTGYVQEIKAKEGELVSLGMSLVSMEKTDQPLGVVAFIPVVGQQVKPDFKVQISPATIKKEEYGFMEGTVRSVSGLPTTTQGMMSMLNNSLLVEQLASRGAPFKIEIDLDTDPKTFSGFKWSSKEGPPDRIESGTVCEVRIVVREQRPITLAIPILKATLGL